MTATRLSSIRDTIGEVGLDEGELRALVDALGVRHPAVLRVRRGVTAGELPFDLAAVPWYGLASRPLAGGESDGVPGSQQAGGEETGDGDASGDTSCGSPPRPSRSLHYAAGDFYLQDAGSLLALAACEADREIPCWFPADRAALACDLCAAPGGKATALVEAIGERGFVLANESIASRVPPLAYNLARTGSDRYAVASADPARLAERLAGVFDLVLVDAPCSGQALMSRGRQSESSIASRQIEHSAARQRRILASAVELLRPGGMLVYSTCTFAEAENEAQMRQLRESFGMEPVAVPRLAPYASDSPDADGCYRLWPHRHATAGSFAAVMRRPGLAAEVGGAESNRLDATAIGARAADATAKKRRPKKRRKGNLQDSPEGLGKGPAGEVTAGDLESWFGRVDRVRLQPVGGSLIGWPDDAPDWAESVALSGPELAYRTGRTWKPAHGAAVRRGASSRRPKTVALDTEAATRFLAGEPIPLSERGWHVVTWRGRPLGWVKGDGRQGKNHLPAAARVRIDSGDTRV